MDINEALKYAKACEYGDGDVYVINSIKALADEVKRLRAQPSPRSMESAPDNVDILIEDAQGNWKRLRWDCEAKWTRRGADDSHGNGGFLRWMHVPAGGGQENRLKTQRLSAERMRSGLCPECGGEPTALPKHWSCGPPSHWCAKCKRSWTTTTDEQVGECT